MRPADISGRTAQLGDATFELRRVDATGDRDLVRTWMHDPEIEPFWEMAWPADRIGAYLQEQLDSAHSNPYIGILDQTPMSYWELYRADLDRLASYCTTRDGDLGVHLLIGRAQDRSRGIGSAALGVVACWQLDADPAAERILAEPDLANPRSLKAFQRAGFRKISEIELPEKRAALMTLDRTS